MKVYTQEELNAIIDKHTLWLKDNQNGERATLRYANLSDANLSRADLSGVSLWSTTGTGREIQTTQTELWTVVICHPAQLMQIGCERHSISDWMNFSDKQISEMDEQALSWWTKWKPVIQSIIVNGVTP